MKRPILAKTMKQLAASPDPVSLFYKGAIAEQLVAEFQAQGTLSSSLVML